MNTDWHGGGIHLIGRLGKLVGGAAMVAGLSVGAAAQALTTLWQFSDNDGSFPTGDLLISDSGRLFGTTTRGGDGGQGTVFLLEGLGSLRVLHSFDWSTEGGQPNALAADGAGNFFGTTYGGGARGGGLSVGCLLRRGFARRAAADVVSDSQTEGGAGGNRFAKCAAKKMGDVRTLTGLAAGPFADLIEKTCSQTVEAFMDKIVTGLAARLISALKQHTP